MANFFTDEEGKRIMSAIRWAERNCSGEIHVHVGKGGHSDVRDSAAEAFARLKMHETELRNGILFYISPEEHQFAVLGDAGINAHVTQDFWDSIIKALEDAFRQGRHADGLCEAISICGRKLEEYFPARPDDKNELPDEVSYD